MPPISGKVILGNQLADKFLVAGFGTEILYSFIIIACSLIIYFGTKELYELSSYKGLKYFRLSFLFFALAYFFRSFIKVILLYFGINRIIDFSPKVFNQFGNLTLLLFMYFSAMSIFYLLYSVMWKSNNSNKIYSFHALAVLIAVISIITRNPIIHLLLNLILVISISIMLYFAHNNKHKKNNLYMIYLLLFIFWILNILDILIPDVFNNFQLFIYLASTGIFLLILFKVIKKTGN
ncbi:MAG: hypothetical protein WC438_00260 [Candidatus Pacearchaeota archaeon]